MTDEMPKVVRTDTLAVLKKAQRYINNGDSKKLKHLSEYAIQNTSIFQDKDSLTLAVIMYAISKLLERWGFEGEYPEQIRNYLSSAEFSIEQGNLTDYRDHISKLADFVAAVDKEFRIYVEKVMEKAQIKKGSSLFEHGISVARSADLLGIGQWELLSYIGKTRINDDQEITFDVALRMKFARSLFTK